MRISRLRISSHISSLLVAISQAEKLCRFQAWRGSTYERSSKTTLRPRNIVCLSLIAAGLVGPMSQPGLYKQYAIITPARIGHSTLEHASSSLLWRGRRRCLSTRISFTDFRL